MSWRIVVISSGAKLDYQMGYLVVRTAETTKIFINEIGTLLIESTAVSLTAALLDFNNRKIKAEVYQELSTIALQNHFPKYNDICAQLQEFMEKLLEEVPYSIAYQSSIGIDELLKAETVELDYSYDSLAEKVCIYLGLLSTACGIRVLFFNDLSRYFTSEEIVYIFKSAQYSKVSIVDICSQARNDVREDVARYILDETLCFWKAE